MKKFIHIGGDSRSGGSLLARLFDGHPGLLSYPFENEFFYKRNEDLINFSQFRQSGLLEDVESQEVVNKIKKFAAEKLTSKQFYDDDKVSFSYERFQQQLGALIYQKDFNDSFIFNAIHWSFFKEFSSGKDFNVSEAVSNHCSRTFLGNMEQFFSVFSKGYFLQTIRAPKSVCASMKNYSVVTTGKSVDNLPDFFVDKVINRWLIALLIGLNNVKSYDGKYVFVLYERLVEEPESYLKDLCRQLGIAFHPEMLIPKFGETTWSGNSSFGKLPSKISTATLDKYKSILNKNEIEKIDFELAEIEHLLYNEDIQQKLETLQAKVLNKIKSRIPNFPNDHVQIRAYFNELHSTLRAAQLNVGK